MAYSLEVNLAEYRGREYRHVSLRSLDEMKVLEKDMLLLDEAAAGYIDRYNKILSDEKDKKLISELNFLNDEYIVINQKITSLSRAGDNKGAEALMLGEGLDVYYRLMDKSEEIANYNGELLNNNAKENAEMVGTSIWISFGTVIIIAIIGMGIATFTSRNIANRLIIMNDSLEETKDLDLTFNNESLAELNKYKSKDEITDSINSLIEMRKSLRDIVGDIKLASHQVSESAIDIGHNIDDTSLTFEGIAKATDDLADGSTDQARDAEDAVVKLDNLTEKINLAVSNSDHVEHSISDINRTNEDGNIAMLDLKKAIVENTNISLEVGNQIEVLENESRSVEKITEVIKSISSQTNLLALNAMIEAARAGESGKGFAVVAEEIRKLAEEVDKNVLSIEDTINNIKSQIIKTKETMGVAGEIISKTQANSDKASKGLQAISDSVENIVDKFSNLIENINEIDRDKDAVILAIQNISAVTEQSSAATEEISASVQEQSAIMEEIAESTKKLNRVVGNVDDIVNRFQL